MFPTILTYNLEGTPTREAVLAREHPQEVAYALDEYGIRQLVDSDEPT